MSKNKTHRFSAAILLISRLRSSQFRVRQLFSAQGHKQCALTCLLIDHLHRQLLDRRGVLMDIPKARPADIFNNYEGLINCAINLNKSLPTQHPRILAEKFIIPCAFDSWKKRNILDKKLLLQVLVNKNHYD